MDAYTEKFEKEGRRIGVPEERLGSYVAEVRELIISFVSAMLEVGRDEINAALSSLSRAKDALAARYGATRHESLVGKIDGPEFKVAASTIDQIFKDLH